jgi:hypothetical protein
MNIHISIHICVLIHMYVNSTHFYICIHLFSYIYLWLQWARRKISFWTYIYILYKCIYISPYICIHIYVLIYMCKVYLFIFINLLIYNNSEPGEKFLSDLIKALCFSIQKTIGFTLPNPVRYGKFSYAYTYMCI